MIVGPSRSGKTPLSFFMAQRGYKARGSYKHCSGHCSGFPNGRSPTIHWFQMKLLRMNSGPFRRSQVMSSVVGFLLSKIRLLVCWMPIRFRGSSVCLDDRAEEACQYPWHRVKSGRYWQISRWGAVSEATFA